MHNSFINVQILPDPGLFVMAIPHAPTTVAEWTLVTHGEQNQKTHSSLSPFRSDSKCLTSTPALICLPLAQLALLPSWLTVSVSGQYLDYSRNWLDKSIAGKKKKKVSHRNSVKKEEQFPAHSPMHVLPTYLLLLLNCSRPSLSPSPNKVKSSLSISRE